MTKLLLLSSTFFTAAALSSIATPVHSATPLCSEYRAWVGGTRYVSGDVVSNRGGVFKCKAGAAGGWCQFAAYEPGTSLGASAWDRQGDCTQPPLYDCPGNPPPAWVANGAYVAGSVVLGKDGFLYQCRDWPNSLFCPQAAFEPGNGTNWTEAWIRGNACVVFEYPDLIVDNILPPRTTCRAGRATSVVVSANVSNQSPFDTQDDVLVSFYDGHPSLGRRIQTVSVAVEPGGTPALASWTWTPGRLGAIDLYVVVDDNGTGVGQESEASETNNVSHLPTQLVCN